jgi:hypothetical protein
MKSHAIAWSLSIVAAPILYLSSVPPLCANSVRWSLPTEGSAAYSTPYFWLCNHTALKKPLLAYYDWWVPFDPPQLPQVARKPG